MSGTSTFKAAHEEVRLLLPWYATDRLDPAERARVEAHLAACEACSAELAAERRLAALSAPIAPDRAVPSPDAGLARLAARLEDQRALVPPQRRSRRPWTMRDGAARRGAPLRWMVAAQFAAIAVLGWMVATPGKPPAAGYHVLGAANATREGNVLAMFRPGTTEADLRRLLTDSGARLTDGPTAAGAYVLTVPGGADGPALARLRANAAVTMAEPIGGPPAP